MIEGKEPLRTFSDLMQFCKHQDEPNETVAAVASESGNQQNAGSPSSESPHQSAENGSQGAPSDTQGSEVAEHSTGHIPESTPTTG